MKDVTAELIAGWRDELTALTGSLRCLFNRSEPRVVFAQYIEGLLAELPNGTGRSCAAVRHTNPEPSGVGQQVRRVPADGGSRPASLTEGLGMYGCGNDGYPDAGPAFRSLPCVVPSGTAGGTSQGERTTVGPSRRT
jgi:hypothetical protein